MSVMPLVTSARMTPSTIPCTMPAPKSMGGLRGASASSREVGPLQLLSRQLLHAVGDDDAALPHHVAAATQVEAQLYVLLDDHHGGSALPDAEEHLEDSVDSDGAQPESRLVQKQDLRLRHESARDDDHLLLAPG